MAGSKNPLSALPTPFLVVDAETTEVLAASGAKTERLGLTLESLVGCPLVAFLDPAPAPTPDAMRGSFSFRRPEGSKVEVQLFSELVSLGDREVLLIQLLETEAPVEALEELARLEISYRAMAEQVPGALFRYRLRPDGTDAVAFMSSGCVDLWEVDAAAIRDDATILWQMVDPADLPAMEDSVMASARSLSPWTHEWRITTPSGKRKWLRGVGRPRREPDGTVEWNSFVMDVSVRVEEEKERSHLAAQLRQASRMESVGRLAGGVAHDFNNMLVVILGSGEAARELAQDNPELVALIDEIIGAAERSAELTRQLLAFSRSREGAARSVDLLVHAKALLPILARLVGDEVQLELLPDCQPCTALIDPSELDQILTNLVANSKDALPKGGRIQLGFAPDLDHPGQSLLEVRENGVGIPEDVAPHLFEPFFSTKDDGPNTGLGLATVYAIVQRRGGTIEVDSTLGKGARFVIRLPASGRPDRPEGLRTVMPKRSTPTQATVLIVDDEAQVRLVLGRLVRSLGYAAAEVSSAAGAMEQLRASPGRFDVVLADIGLRRVDGLSLRELVSREFPCVVVVLMTGNFHDGAANVPVLEKPFSAEQLEAALARALSERAA